MHYLDIHEDDPLDEAQMATWIRQAAALPGFLPVAPAGILASSPSTRPNMRDDDGSP